jgi:hypothetical protein
MVASGSKRTMLRFRVNYLDSEWPKADMYPCSIRPSAFWPEQVLAFRWRRLI